MGVIVQLQPGDGILARIVDFSDGKGGTELLVLEVDTVDGDQFTAKMLHDAQLGEPWVTECDGRFVFSGTILEHYPFKVRLRYHDTEGRFKERGVSIEQALYLGPPVNETVVTVATPINPRRDIPCHAGNYVLTGVVPWIPKAIYEHVVVPEHGMFIYMHSNMREQLSRIVRVHNWPAITYERTTNFADADCHIVPVSAEVAHVLKKMKGSPEYNDLDYEWSCHLERWEHPQVHLSSAWPNGTYKNFLNKPAISEFMEAEGPHLILCLVDTVDFFMKKGWRNNLREKYEDQGKYSDEYLKLVCMATRVIADRMEFHANDIYSYLEEPCPFELLLRESIALLKETPEYQCVGVFGEKCEESCDSSCPACRGGEFRREDHLSNQDYSSSLPRLRPSELGMVTVLGACDSATAEESEEEPDEDSEGNS